MKALMNAHYIYVAPAMDDAYARDLEALKDRPVMSYACGAVGGALTPRRVVRHLSRMQCLGLVLPNDCERHTPAIEGVKACARLMGVPVMPLTRFLLETMPATVIAVPATQQFAVVG